MKAVFSALGRAPKIAYVDMPEHLQGKYQYHTVADMRKLRQVGYGEAFTELEDAVRDYVQAWLSPMAKM